MSENSEVKDILNLMEEKFKLINEALEKRNQEYEELIKGAKARDEVVEDLIDRLDELTQRANTQLKAMYQLTNRLEKAQ